VGIIDFRLFPIIDETKMSVGYKKVSESLKVVSGNAIALWFIYLKAKGAHIEEIITNFFPNHVFHREIKYVYSRGEPAYFAL